MRRTPANRVLGHCAYSPGPINLLSIQWISVRACRSGRRRGWGDDGGQGGQPKVSGGGCGGGGCGAVSAAAPCGPAAAADPAFLSLGVGYFNVFEGTGEAAAFRLEYRSDLTLWIFKPFAAAAVTSAGSVFIGGGILADIYLGHRLVLSGSFGPFYYAQGASDFDLGYPLEFRSQGELAYRFDNRARLGIAISHYSNGGLGDGNSGSETISLNFAIPLGPGSADE